VGASSSAIGNNGTWVPIPVVLTITTTQRAQVSSTPVPTSLVTVLVALPASIAAPSLNRSSQLEPVVSSIVATTQFDKSNNFSIPLHNVFDLITPREFPLNRPVLELVSPDAHVDVQPVESTKWIQKPREELENPFGNCRYRVASG
jgi:hypothetical protein